MTKPVLFTCTCCITDRCICLNVHPVVLKRAKRPLAPRLALFTLRFTSRRFTFSRFKLFLFSFSTPGVGSERPGREEQQAADQRLQPDHRGVRSTTGGGDVFFRATQNEICMKSASRVWGVKRNGTLFDNFLPLRSMGYHRLSLQEMSKIDLFIHSPLPMRSIPSEYSFIHCSVSIPPTRTRHCV